MQAPFFFLGHTVDLFSYKLTYCLVTGDPCSTIKYIFAWRTLNEQKRRCFRAIQITDVSKALTQHLLNKSEAISLVKRPGGRK